MRFWFEHSPEVSLREQVVTQVRLGILCGELEPGERLPSIRELARRFHIHPNTVSAGYQELVEGGWLESRRGSGVYAREPRTPDGNEPASAGMLLDRVIAQMFRGSRRLGFRDEEAVRRVGLLAETMGSKRGLATRVVLVEPDPELRAIVLAELRSLTRAPVEGCGFGECGSRLAEALIVALPSKVARVEAELRAASDDPFASVLKLGVRSVPESLAARLPARVDQREGILLGIVSRWSTFAGFARTMLIAAGFEDDSLLIRNPCEPGWQQGLEQTAAVVCDLLSAAQLPAGKAVVFRILAENTQAQLGTRLETGRAG